MIRIRRVYLSGLGVVAALAVALVGSPGAARPAVAQVPLMPVQPLSPSMAPGAAQIAPSAPLIVAKRDLQLTLSAPTHVKDGRPFPFAVQISNEGPFAAKDVRLDVWMWWGLEAASVSGANCPALGKDTGADGIFNTECRLTQPLAPGQSVVVVFTAKNAVHTSYGLLRKVRVRVWDYDWDLKGLEKEKGNNVAEAEVSVAP